MSAVLKERFQLDPMRTADLDEVIAIERAVYSHPWTHGNFVDSLNAGYLCCTYRIGAELVGYFIMIVAVGEAHLLNLSVAAASQRQGRGSALLEGALRIARERDAKHLFLEVRPSNAPALALYSAFSFRRTSRKRCFASRSRAMRNAPSSKADPLPWR